MQFKNYLMYYNNYLMYYKNHAYRTTNTILIQYFQKTQTIQANLLTYHIIVALDTIYEVYTTNNVCVKDTMFDEVIRVRNIYRYMYHGRKPSIEILCSSMNWFIQFNRRYVFRDHSSKTGNSKNFYLGKKENSVDHYGITNIVLIIFF